MVVSRLTKDLVKRHLRRVYGGRIPPGTDFYVVEDGSGRDSVRGFGIRVRSSSVSYIHRHGRRSSFFIGPADVMPLDDARHTAAERRLRILTGQATELRQRDHTFTELKERFFRAHVIPNTRPRTVEAYELSWRSRILPEFGKVKLRELTAERVDAWKLRSRRTPVAFNRALQQLQSGLNYAMKIEWIHRNVAAKIDFFPERPRRRRITPDEYARLGEALREGEASGLISPPALAAIWTILLTGCRPFEVLKARLEWAILEGEDPQIAWPPGTAKGDRRGHERGRLVLLPHEVAERLRSLERPEGCEWLIPGTHPGKPMFDLKKAWPRLLQLAGLESSGITPRDARTSFRSEAPVVGVAREHIAGLMGHAPGSPITDSVYLQIMSPELARASRAMSEHLASRLGVLSASEEDA